jgi:hypothetical protein
MKIQAWGWLIAGVLAAGLNASYHDGGLEWAHQVADQVKHGSAAVLALAIGRTDQFLTEARIVIARNEHASCPLSAAMARVQSRIERSQTRMAQVRVARLESMSDLDEAQMDRLDADRDRIEAQVQAQVDTQIARIRIPAVAVNPVVFRSVRVTPACPRVHVSVPRIPMMRMPVAPMVRVETSSPGPI